MNLELGGAWAVCVCVVGCAYAGYGPGVCHWVSE